MKVRIIGDGTPYGSRVEDEFGRILPVQSVWFEIDSAGDGSSRCVLTLAPAGILLDLDFQNATVATPP